MEVEGLQYDAVILRAELMRQLPMERLPHMGHAKTYVSFDAVVRYLQFRGYDVLYVQNITDVGHLMQDADEEGGLKPQLPLSEEPSHRVGETSSGEDRLFEDDSDAASDRNQMQHAASGTTTVRRGHAVTRDDDDVLPAF